MKTKLTKHPPCLDRSVLADFILGKLTIEEAERIATEVEACPACQAALETLDDLEDSVVRDIRTISRLASTSIDPGLEAAIRRAATISRQMWLEDRASGPDSLTGLGDSADDQPLTQLGQYELICRIGRGGMGTVFKAIHTRLKRPVAMKVLPKHRLRDPQAVARFQREMEAVGRLDHPNLVRAYDAGETGGQHFLAMELVQGMDLSRLVRTTGPLSVADACEVCRQAALGLQHAHEHGLIHRDVKPSNLMLTIGGQIKVLDLGLARLITTSARTDEVTGADQIVGTGDFIAPEQGEDTRQADARSDIYALGCTLYFLLASQTPFCGPAYDTFIKKILAHLLQSVPSIREVRSDVPEGVTAVLDRMLAKRADERFQTAVAVADALSHWCKGASLKRLATLIPQAGVIDDSTSLSDTPGVSLPSCSTNAVAKPRQSVNRLEKPSPRKAVWSAILLVATIATLAMVWAQFLSPGTERPRLDVPPPVSTILAQARATESLPSALPALNRFALVPRPAVLPGLQSWTIETRGERAPITVLALSPKNDLLATGSEVGCVRIWYAATGDLVRVIVEPDRIYGLAWSPNDERVAVASGRLRLWDSKTGKLLWQVKLKKDDPALSVAWAEGGLLASGHRSGLVRLWKPETRELVQTLVGHRAGVTALAFTRDGTRLASGGDDRTIRLWELPTYKPLAKFQDTGPGGVHRLAWSPDGGCLASSTHGKTFTVRREREKWQPRVVEVTLRAVNDLAWSPTGERFAAATGWPGEQEFLHVWDADLKKEMVTQSIWPSCAITLDWTSDGRVLYCSQGDGGLITYEPTTKAFKYLRPASLPGSLAIAWGPDSSRLVLGGLDRTTRVWDVKRCRQVFATDTHNHPIISVAWALQGDLVAAGSRDAMLKILDARTGQVRQEIQCDNFVMDIAFAPNGRLIASAEGSGLGRLWEIGTGKEVCREGESGKMAFVATAWSPDGQHVAFGGWDDKIRLVDLDQQPLTTSWITGHGRVRSLWWSPTGTILATSGLQPGVHYWQTPEGRMLRKAEGDPQAQQVEVSNLGASACTSASGRLRVISPDGTYLAIPIGSAWGIKNLKSGQTEETLCPLVDKQGLTILANGDCEGEPSSIESLLYVVQHPDYQENLTAEQFEARYRQDCQSPRSQAAPDTQTPHSSENRPARHTKSPPEQLTNSIGIRLRLVPAGEFTMGSPNSDVDADVNEKPVPTVAHTQSATEAPDPEADRNVPPAQPSPAASQPPSPSGPKVVVESPDGVRADRPKPTQRDVAELVLQRQGAIRIVGSSQVYKGALADLPESFEIQRIAIAHPPIPVTDAELERIATQCDPKKMVRFELWPGPGVTDRGAKSLCRLSNLTMLTLAVTKVSDEGVKAIATGLPKLRWLNLCHSRVTDTGLRYLRNLRQLKDLFLWEAPVTDEGLKSLGDVPSLEVVDLDRCKNVTDAGLSSLVKLEGLRELVLTKTSVTEDGIKRFQQLRPSVKIRWEAGPESKAPPESVAQPVAMAEPEAPAVLPPQEATASPSSPAPDQDEERSEDTVQVDASEKETVAAPKERSAERKAASHSGTSRRAPRGSAKRAPKTIPEAIEGELRLERQDGPYKLQGRVKIAKGGSLFLERGTTVIAAPGAAILVEGTIKSFGEDEEFVRFRPENPAVGWDTIKIPRNCPQELEWFDIRGADRGLDMDISKAEVKNCVFAQNKVGLRITGGGSSEGGEILQWFRNCMITSNLQEGILLHGHRIGLDHCTISYNGGVGLNMTYYGYPDVTACLILGNQVGIRSNLYTTHLDVKGSNIVGNRAASIEVKTDLDFQCRGNYWGTNNERQIALSILDGRDQAGRGVVIYQDFQAKPIPEAGCSLKIRKER